MAIIHYLEASMNQPILLIMAAGMGSRYGGMKQVDPVGPGGEAILDYSLFDAHRAGFRRVIFLIRPEMAEDFKAHMEPRLRGKMEAIYAFQDISMLPEGFTVPEGRKKPWGTGHAVLCCKDHIDAPFCAINADDYYGVKAFQLAYDFLSGNQAQDLYMMVAYELKNTVTQTGYVSRGVCSADENSHLKTIVETTHIISTVDGPLYTEDGETYRKLAPETPVSMNFWGFMPSLLPALERDFRAFLTANGQSPKAEFYLPFAVNDMIGRGEAGVQMLTTPDSWHGVTYREDKPEVQRAIRELIDAGVYPEKLYED